MTDPQVVECDVQTHRLLTVNVESVTEGHGVRVLARDNRAVGVVGHECFVGGCHHDLTGTASRAVVQNDGIRTISQLAGVPRTGTNTASGTLSDPNLVSLNADSNWAVKSSGTSSKGATVADAVLQMKGNSSGKCA